MAPIAATGTAHRILPKSFGELTGGSKAGQLLACVTSGPLRRSSTASALDGQGIDERNGAPPRIQ
jgi:hypothetical protein